MTGDQDVLVLEDVMAGRPSALLELYDRHAPLVFKQAYAALRDKLAAEDVVQETFTAAWFEARSWVDSGGAVVDWLLQLARERLQNKGATGSAAATAIIAAEAPPLPQSLRDRVLDSIYGAGERLRPPYTRPQWARSVTGHWLVWVLVVLTLALAVLLG
jgi:DNA-directed RNA polymerase specialized sigma24 family protein